MAVKPPIDLSVRWNLSVRPEGAAPLAFDGELDAVSTPVEVSSIEFIGAEYPEYQEQYVRIHFEVPKGTVWSAKPEHIQQILDKQIAQGLRARVQGQGFLGANILALEYLDPKVYPVEPVPWTPKHYYIPSAPSQFNRVMTSLEKSLRRAEDLDLAELLDRAKAKHNR